MKLCEYTMDKSSCEIVASVVHLSTYGFFSPATAADTVFGEVYSYLNPARPGEHPTFHVEVDAGLDAEYLIYNIAGSLVYIATDASPLKTITRGGNNPGL